MRAVVVDTNSRHMVVLKDDGTFEKVKRVSGAQIGDEISLSAPKTDWNKVNRYVGIAASIVLLLLGGIQVKTYYTPYGYVSIDINPSIELGFNKYERIISTRGLNGDGEKVLANTPSVKHSTIEDGAKNIVETASKANYIKSDQDNNIMFTIYTPNGERNKSLNTKINSSVSQYLKTSGKKAELINEIVSKEDLDKAALQKISVGKLKLYEKAKSVGSSITIDDIKNKPVRDIVKMIRDAKKETISDDNNTDVNKHPVKDKKTSSDNQDSPAVDSSPVNAGVMPSDGTQQNNDLRSTETRSERRKARKNKREERNLIQESNLGPNQSNSEAAADSEGNNNKAE